MLSLNSVVVIGKAPVFSAVGDEVVILNPQNGNYYGLDPLGARIWALIQEPTVVSQVRDTLLAEYEVDIEECERDLLEILEHMAAQGLIEVQA
jgi:hypothetical protein